MENKFDTNEIEESLRICEELFQNNPDFNRRAPRPVEALELAKDVNSARQDVQQVSQEMVPEPEIVPEPKPEPEEEAPLQTESRAESQQEPEENPEPQPEPKREKTDCEPIQESKTEEEPEHVSEPETEEKPKPNIKKNLIAFGICIVVAIGIALFITNFVASHTKVEGTSMEATLDDGDDIIVEKVSYLTSDPERYDIIVFRESESIHYIKRVIALPGETIQITEGKIYINERAVFDAYGNAKMEDGGIAEKPIKLGKDEYFVLGDNRNASKDSRDKEVGVIKRDQIIGKAWLRVLPFDHFGKLE